MHHRSFRSALVGVAIALAASFTPAAAHAQGAGTIEGTATGEDSGAPIAFALVRLLRAGQDTTAPPQVVTGSAGRYRFAGVTAGDYRVQLLRIGHRPATSPVVRVADGATVRQDLRVATLAVELPAVTVRAGETCVGLAGLAEHPQLATLWAEARKGVEIRRAFERQHRFVRVRREEARVERRIGGTRLTIEIDTIVNEPDSARVREERRRTVRRRDGYRTGNSFALPDERDLLDDDFLRDHCLDVAVESSEGVLGLRFRPAARPRDGTDVQGVAWVDARTFRMRRLDVEWLDDGGVSGGAQLDYADVDVGGIPLRLPSGGSATITRANGAARLMVRRAVVTLAFAYQGFAAADATGRP